MGISFLNPLFLIGLTALTVPILVHLVQSHRGERMKFPSLMFVDKMSFSTLRRAKIRNWFLFLLRAIAFTLIVLAFARPILGGGLAEIAAAGGEKDLIILLDGSYSMAYADHWERAVDAARRAIGNLGRGDRAGIVLFDESADLVSVLTGDQGRLRAVVESLSPGDRSTRFGPPLELARQLLEESELPNREILLISDFQRTGWQGTDMPRLPSWLTLTPINLSEPDFNNVTVASIQLQRRHEQRGSLLTLNARLLNHGTEPLSGQEVDLVINGEERGRHDLDISAGGLGSASFEDVSLSDSEIRGTVTVTEDHLPEDNAFRFVLSSGTRLSALIIERERARREESLFIERALSIGDRPSFSAVVTSENTATGAQIANHSLVILNGTAGWGAENAQTLLDFVEGGGGLFVVLGEAGFRGSGGSPAEQLIPVTSGGVIEVSETNGRALGELDYDHPVFEVFSEPRSGDFTAARFYRYQRLADGWNGDVIARFSDGSPALLDRKIGNGRVLVWTSTLDNYWNDLALKPVFLPFLHQIARHVTGYRDYREWYSVGETIEFFVPGDLSGAVVQALTPAGESVTLITNPGTLLLPLDQPGFYELENVPEDWDAPVTFAVNRDRGESDLESIDIEEFLLATAAVETSTAATGLEAAVRPEIVERRQSVWWYLLLAVGLLMGVETVISNRLSREELRQKKEEFHD